MAEPRIEVCCREDAAAFRCAAPWAAISIATDDGDWPDLDPTCSVGVLRRHFADLEEPRPNERLFDAADARAILDFVAAVWPRIEVLLIHCQAGLRRSPAVAAAVSRIYLGRDSAWFRRGVYEPNLLVYETLLNVARERGEFLDPRNPRRKRGK